MLDSYTNMIKDCFKLKGRVDRHNYWLGILIALVIMCVLIWFAEKITILGVLPYLYAVLMLPPIATATVRRLHDVGRSSWWVFLSLIPIIGWVGLFIYLIQTTVSEKDIEAKKKAKKMPPTPRLRGGL